MLLDTGTKDLMPFGRGISGTLQNLRVCGKDINLTVGGHDRVAQVEMQEFKVAPIVRRRQKVYAEMRGQRVIEEMRAPPFSASKGLDTMKTRNLRVGGAESLILLFC